jgi:predicted hydrocarbon binding protein
MAQYEPFTDRVEARGQTILSFVDAFPPALQGRAESILADNGIEDPEPDEWYPQEAWLTSFEEIDEKMGTKTLNKIGKAIPKNAEWPPGVETVVGGLESIDEAYHMNHRGGEIGYYEADPLDDGTVEVQCHNPYPCAFDRGILEGVVEEFANARASITEVGDDCRTDGADECLYRVTSR